MWLAEKPQFQLELAERLAALTHSMRGDGGVAYLRVFWQTMLREWHLIDRHRYAPARARREATPLPACGAATQP